jgi:type IV secretory pathway VirJ component
MLDSVRLTAFLGLAEKADFRINPSGWLGDAASKEALPVLPEFEKLHGKNMICFYGVQEKDNIAALVDKRFVKVIALPGGHHFNGHYDVIADSVLANLRISQLGK